MPGVYQTGEIDLVGTVVGVVEREAIIDGSTVQAGDAILALPSSGLHTNGFTLARRVLEELVWTTENGELGTSVGDALLAVHRCYLPQVQALWDAEIEIRALAHITGGGVYDNLPRVLPHGLGATIWRGSWPQPPIFNMIQRLGKVSDDEMLRVFNMGLGMLVVAPQGQVEHAQATLSDDLFAVGAITSEHNRIEVH
jgi:phosphoribosylformylglycinamidine cyclo-ligase